MSIYVSINHFNDEKRIKRNLRNNYEGALQFLDAENEVLTKKKTF